MSDSKLWFDTNLKFEIKDYSLLTCERCNETKPITRWAFGYGSEYLICEDCYEELNK